MTLALPLLVALSALNEDPKLLPTDALAPVIQAAKTLKCGMTRDEVKAAFANVKPPDDKNKDPESGEEIIMWHDVTTPEKDGKSCSVIVWIGAGTGRIRAVSASCLGRGQPDHWGETKGSENSLHYLYCTPKTKKPAPK